MGRQAGSTAPYLRFTTCSFHLNKLQSEEPHSHAQRPALPFVRILLENYRFLSSRLGSQAIKG